jgi:hypothetical protein
MEYLHQTEEQYVREGRSFAVEGLDNYHQFTPHALSARMSSLKLVRERAQMSERAEQLHKYAQTHQFSFSEPVAGMLDRYNFVYLRRGADKSESNVMQGNYLGCHLKLFDYSHTSAPDYYVEHRHTLMILIMPAPIESCPTLVVTPENYLERYLVEFNELDWYARTRNGEPYRLFTQGETAQSLAYVRRLESFLKTHPRLYLECRGKAILAFYPNRELATPDDLDSLLELARLLATPATASA